MFDGCIIGMNNQWVSNAPLSWAHGVLLLPNCQGHILHRHCHRGSGTCPQNGLKFKRHHDNSKTKFDMSSYSVQETMEMTHKTCETLDTISTEDYVSMTYHERHHLWNMFFFLRIFPSSFSPKAPGDAAAALSLGASLDSEEESAGLNRNHSNYAHIW